TGGERAPSAPADAVRAAAGERDDARGQRVGQEAVGFGVRLRLPGTAVRLARREDARLALGPGLALGLDVRGGRIGRLVPPLVLHAPHPLPPPPPHLPP